MDGPVGSVGLPEADELERLRRRAYGPDADIGGDSAAQARLSELEAAHRSRTASHPLAGLPDPTAAGPVPVPDPEPPPETDQPVFAAKAAASRRRWLPVLGGVLGALALIANHAFVAELVATSTAPPPEVRTPNYDTLSADFLLQRSPDGAVPPDPHGTLDRLGLEFADLRRYQNFEQLGVWSGTSRYGTTCLLVAHPVQGLNEGIGAEGCSPAGVDTPADLLVLDSPSRALIRFVLKDDYVAVYVYAKAARSSR